MKKILVLLFSVLVFASVAFSANTTVGSGAVAVLPVTALTGDNFHFNTFTYTYTAATNVVKGIVYCKYPFNTWGTAVSKITMGGNAVEAKKATEWTDGANHYFGATVTCANAGTVTFAWATTVCAQAAVQAFTWYEANFSMTPVPTGSSGQTLAANCTITVSDANNPITLDTFYPALAGTPFILSTEKTNMVYKGHFNAPCSGGQMIINLNPGKHSEPGAQSLPAPLTWVAQALTSAMNNAVCISARAGVFGTPTCNGTRCVVAIGTVNAAETFQVVYGPNATTTPGIGVQGVNYSDGIYIDFKSNAFFEAATVTPYAQPTAFVNTKGNYGQIVRVPTPTIVLTVTANIDGSYTCYGTGYNGSQKTVLFGSQWQGQIDRNATRGTVNTPADMIYGAYTISLIDRWQDVLNDSTWITTTATASTSIMPKNFDLLSGIANGIVNKDYFVQSVAAAGPMNVTIFASAQAILKIDCWSNSACSFSRIVNGSANTINAIFIPALATAGSFGAISSPYTIPAAAVSQWYNNTAGTVTVNGIIYRIALPTR